MENIRKSSENFPQSPTMPLLFLGHGSPMNAIEENEFVQGFRAVASGIRRPNAILCISAHWETRGTKATAVESPPTIHDFGGFPPELYEVEYPAPGSPELAKNVSELVKKGKVYSDDQWGLDHGTWSVLKHMYPSANVPVVQLSLDRMKSPERHYDLGRELYKLRTHGVLIVGSGNLVHNLQRLSWNRLNEIFAYDWTEETNNRIKQYILDGNHNELINFSQQGKDFQMSIPTPEHYLPLLYILALQEKKEEVSFFNDQSVGGSLSMTSVKIG